MEKKRFLILILLMIVLTLIMGCAPSVPPVLFGTIDLNSTPVGAKVYLDGIYTGQVTPIILTNVGVGDHAIKLELSHYKIWENNSVNVVANETSYLNPPLTYASTQYITLQPGAEGKDTAVQNTTPAINYGDYSYVCIGSWGGGTGYVRWYIQFDLSSVPINAKITDADLSLYQYSGIGSTSFNIGLYQVTSDWDENTIDWDPQPISSTDVEITNSVSPAGATWESWDIDTLVQGWLDGTITNYGALLKDTDESSVDTYVYFRTSDYTTDTTKRPKLVLAYYIP